jgi:hypothetical protein
MSAAKIAASLRFTGWTGTLGSSSSEYSELGNRYETFQAQIVTAWLPGILSSAFRRSGSLESAVTKVCSRVANRRCRGAMPTGRKGGEPTIRVNALSNTRCSLPPTLSRLMHL